MRAVGRIFAAMIGFVAAVIAAAAFLLAARVGVEPANPEHAAWFWGNFVVYAGLAASMLGAAAFVPFAILVLVTEIFSIRSFVVHVGAGGLIGLAGALGEGGLGLVGSAGDAGPVADGSVSRATLLLAAGFVAGLVYWLLAGRMAGLAPPAPPPLGVPARDEGRADRG